MTLTFSVSPYVLFCLPMRDPRENLSSLERNDSSRVVGCRHVFGQRSFSPFWSHQMRWVSAPLGDTACLRSTFGVCGFLSLNHKSYFSVLAKTPGNQVLIKIQLNSAKTRSKHERLSCRNGWWGNEGRQGQSTGEGVRRWTGAKTPSAHLRGQGQGSSTALDDHNCSVSTH